MLYSMAGKVLTEQLQDDPENISLYQSFAMVCHEMGEYEKAIETYERIIALDSNQAMSLNNGPNTYRRDYVDLGYAAANVGLAFNVSGEWKVLFKSHYKRQSCGQP